MGESRSVAPGARQNHRRLVLDVLRQSGPQSKTGLTQRTGLSGNTVASLVKELRQAGVVTMAPARSTTPSQGRPPKVASLSPTLAGLAAIEFGSGLIRVAISDLGQTIVATRECSLPAEQDPRAALDQAASMVREALVEAEIPHSKLMGVGVALPAPVDRERDILHSTTFPGPGWALPGFHPARELSERLDVPVEADNDANLAALAELVGGAADGYSHFIYVKAAAGIGCGLVLDGKLYRGADGTAGELAHIVVEPHGDLCYCGNWGCLWTVVGAQGIEKTFRLARPSGGTVASQEYYEDLVRQVIDDARREDVLCQRALEDAGRQLGRAVGNLCNILKPNLVVVGGTLSFAGELFLRPMQESLDEYRSSLSRDVVLVVPGALGTRAELQGALALVFQSEADDVRNRLHSLITARI